MAPDTKAGDRAVVANSRVHLRHNVGHVVPRASLHGDCNTLCEAPEKEEVHQVQDRCNPGGIGVHWESPYGPGPDPNV